MTQKSATQEMEKYLLELTSTPVGRRTFLLGMGLLLNACASSSQTRYREGDNEGQAAALTIEEERAMTAKVLPDMRKEYPVIVDVELQNYVSQLGKRIVQANRLESNPYQYTFSVVDVAYVNAFALPAGTVFVTAPLLEMAESEAELAGVIGHEVGHIKARHTAERMFKAQKEQSKSVWYGLGGGILGGALGYGLGKMACPPRDQACLAKATELGAVAGVSGGLLVQKFGFMANSREDEMEADRIGFRTAVNAGYHKDYVGRFYAKLLKMEQQSKKGSSPLLASVADAMSTHPPSQERVNQMEALAAEQKPQAGAITSSRDFAKAQNLAARYAAAARSRKKS